MLLIFLYHLIFDLSQSIYTSTYWSVDATSYRDAAKLLYTKGFKPHIILSSGYPLILGLPLFLIDNFSDTALVTCGVVENLIFYFSSSVLLYYIIAHYTNTKYASIYCFLLCLFPGYTALITETLAEVFFIFLLLLSFRLYQLSFLKSYRLLFYLCLSLLLLTKPIATYPVLIICGTFLIKSTYSYIKQKKYRINYSSLIPIAVYIIQAAWVHQSYPMYSYNCVGQKTMYAYLLARSQSFETGEDFSDLKNQRNKILYNTPAQLFPQLCDSALKQEIGKQIPHNIHNIFKALLYHIFVPNMLDGSYNISELKTNNNSQQILKTQLYNISKVENIIYTLLLFLLFLFHTFNLFKKRKLSELFILNLICVFFLVLSGISCFQGDRLHIIILPFLLVLLSATMYQLKFKTHAR
ncbi:MAG: hypothetical protein SGJ10_13405 [Bacteroidota bacterium]|nr:hypothetical protein [Bacteroidota bacterium]